MALNLKYKDEHGIVQINMSPTSTPDNRDQDIVDPKFDTINNRFAHYDLFGGKYDSGEEPSLFRSRYNSIEEELANTPYAFATERVRNPFLDITIKHNLHSPSKDIEDNRFFKSEDSELFGPQLKSDEESAFTVTQLIHAQDRYFDLSGRSGTVSAERDCDGDEAFKVLPETAVKAVQVDPVPIELPVVPTSKRKREKSFAIIAETPVASRPSSPRSLPVDTRVGRTSPFKGRGFREETSRHNTPKTSAANSRANSPPRRRTHSLSRIDKMAQAATLPPPIHLPRPRSPRNFLKENMEEVREISELNREKHEAEAEQKRKEEEEAILKEMGLLDKSVKSDTIKSVVCSRTTSRSNSPNKIILRSRSNSPSAILLYENIPTDSKEFINPEDGMAKPVTHRSRLRTVSKSQPQSNDGSPKHSKIPKRQNSVSPARKSNNLETFTSRKPVENNLNRNQRFISNSTSSIHETIKIGSQVHDKRGLSKSTQLLNISPALIKGKPPISPGRGGPPPSNRTINSKRLSPIVGTPNKSPVEALKPSSAKTPVKPFPATRKSVKTAGNTPATSRFSSRQPSRAVSRDPSPEKRRTVTKGSTNSRVNNNTQGKPVSRASSTKINQKPIISTKPDPKKPISRTSSMKSLTRTPSTKALHEKSQTLKKRDSKIDLREKTQSTSKINEVGKKTETVKEQKKSEKAEETKVIKKEKGKESIVETNEIEKKGTDLSTDTSEEVQKQDNETQYDKITNENGELVIMTKKNIVSMTTAAITSQPLEVVTTVTNQLPAALEKAREKGMFERLGSKDSLAPKEEIELDKDLKQKESKIDSKETVDEKDKTEEKKHIKQQPGKHEKSSFFGEDNIKLKPLQPPYNNPQVERVKQKIDDILKEPEVSTENILVAASKPKENKNIFKNIADKTKTDVKEAKDDVANKLSSLKDQVVKQNEKITAEIRSEATKIVDSIITPVEEPKELKDKLKEDLKKDIEPIVTVVNEKKNGPKQSDVAEKITETLVKGEPEVEVQSSNMSTPGLNKTAMQRKMVDGNDSEKSTQSNGGFPQSTSTTPKPPARANRQSKEEKKQNEPTETQSNKQTKPPNICQRLMGKCKSKCCPCCIKPADEGEKEAKESTETVEKKGAMSKLNCFKKNNVNKEEIKEIERAAGKASIEFENETKRKRKLRDILCGCCGSRRRVSDVSARDMADVGGVAADTGCCGRTRQPHRRDSILSDRPPATCCNNRLCMWIRGACRRHSEQSSSRRTSMFSKNKSLSPTLPPEDTRKKLDASLVEHTSVMRGAIPVLPICLAYFCLLCNILVPGLGTIFSGMFCLCFGIPRFGVHDGVKQRIGSFLINLLVGCGQLFTVLFCLVGWGWSIWWGVIMLRISRKYRKLKAEAAAEEAAEAPPVTANNHTQA